jgi:hypothetical protein
MPPESVSTARASLSEPQHLEVGLWGDQTHEAARLQPEALQAPAVRGWRGHGGSGRVESARTATSGEALGIVRVLLPVQRAR